MKVSELLFDARRVISDSANWIQGAMARDKDGDMTHPQSPRAICFCALGAIVRAAHLNGFPSGEYQMRLRVVMATHLATAMQKLVPEFNDSHNHAEVLAAFDTAITNAKARGE